jgi:hypothetical protein
MCLGILHSTRFTPILFSEIIVEQTRSAHLFYFRNILVVRFIVYVNAKRQQF